MDLSLLILGVDGSIANPTVAWAIGLWSSVLTVVAFLAARRFRRHTRTRLTTLAGLLAIGTPIAVRVIATLFYVLPAQRSVTVHFWGFSPLQWLGPALALVVFAIVAWWPKAQVAVV